jgi:hypothetical protein
VLENVTAIDKTFSDNRNIFWFPVVVEIVKLFMFLLLPYIMGGGEVA